MTGATMVMALLAFAARSASAGTPTVNLSITKTDGVLTAVPGETVTYTIVAFNSGPNTSPGSMFGDLFVSPLSNCSWTCAGQNGGACTTAMGSGPNANQSVDLPVGGSVLVSATCTIDPSATLSFFNTATITPPMGFNDPNGMNNSATDVDGLAPEADLAITKTDGHTTFIPGGSTTYSIVASNLGPSDAPGAAVTDTFAAALNCTWTCSGSAGGTCTGAGVGNINDMVSLPAGASVTYLVDCDIAASAPNTLSNTATVLPPADVPDTNPDNNSATDIDALNVQGAPALGGIGLAAACAGLLLVAVHRMRQR